MLPGAAARAPTKQARDCRLQPARQSFPARSRRCQSSILEAVFSDHPKPSHAERDIQIARDGRRDFKRRDSAGVVLSREAANFFHSRAHLFQICGVGADGGATARPVLPRP